MKRVFDMSRIEEIANLPEVRPALGGEGPIEFGKMAFQDGFYAFEYIDCALVLTRSFGTRYEVHSIFGRTGLRRICDLSRFMFEYMFTRTDCEEIITKVPANNGVADHLTQKLGFIYEFTRTDAWKEGVDIAYWKLPLDTWARACSPAMEAGGAFHAQLDAAKRDAGSELISHPHDPVHDATVGAAMMMARNGQLAKGVNVYNRWAVFAGYVPVNILTVNPPVIDISDAMIEIRPDGLEILLCR